MTAKELVDNHKIYLEDLERWVVPLEIVDEALAIKGAKELEENLEKLEMNMNNLQNIFKNING